MVRTIVQFFCASLLLSSCENSESLIEQESNLSTLGDTHPSGTKALETVNIPNQVLLEELQKNFDKPLRFYPLIDAEMIRYSKSGLVYRVGMNDPFTGRVQKKYDDGVVQFQASFLKGVPHGLHLRRFDNGKLSMESVFDQGVLTGIKKSWWSNGSSKEEQYWHNGTYQGRTMWDEEGRQIRKEWARN